ncbi:hypothetical protein [Allokutzneria oryzae]|uniref:Flagellar protein FliT n=1 Tax=Allokutzneria oryzae TaxID=1378989 RepID=A0ABV6A727_9PSEU
MTVDRELGQIAEAIDRAMHRISTAQTDPSWEHVEWLRLKADLLDRLAAAQRGTGQIARRAELIRDRAERMADELTRIIPAAPPGQHRAEVVQLWADGSRAAAER